MLAQFIWTVVHWLVIPGIIAYIFLFALSVERRQVDPDRKTSARAGLWAGMILFVVFVVTQLHYVTPPSSLTAGAFPDLNAFVVLVFGTLGFAAFFAIRRMIPTRLIGFAMLVLAGGSSIALYTYLFLSPLKDLIILLVLGLMLGVFMHIMVFPEPMRHLLPAKSSGADEHTVKAGGTHEESD